MISPPSNSREARRTSPVNVGRVTLLAAGASGLLVIILLWLHARQRPGAAHAIAESAPLLRALDAAFVPELLVVATLTALCIGCCQLARRGEIARRAFDAQSNHLEAAMGAAPLGTWEWIPATGAVRWSKNVWAMFGLEPDSRTLSFADFRDALHPDDREHVLRRIERALNDGLPYHLEARVVRPDGSVRWMLTHGKVTRDEQGQPIRMAGVDVDITAQKETDAARRISDELFATAFEATALGMGIVGRDGRWIKVNEALCTLLGLARETLLSLDFQTLTHPDDLTESLRLRDELYAGHIGLLKQEKRYRHGDGHYFWTYVTVGLVRNPDGSPRYHVTQVQDIDARKRAEAAVVEARTAAERSERAKSELLERLNEAQHAARIGSWSWDLTTGEVWWSDELYRIFELDVASYTPSVDANAAFVHEGDREAYQAAIAHALQTGDGFEHDLRINGANGARRQCRSRGYVERGPEGIPARVFGTFQDRTEACLLEDQLREAQKMESLGRLAGGIAHDFNNLLAAILGNIALARAQANDAGAVGEKLARIDEAAQRAKSLVDQILTFSRRRPLELAATDVGAVVEEALRLLRGSMPASIDISAHIDAAQPPALADAAQLHQIVMNLCTNAWHALRERELPGGRIELKVYGTTLDTERARRIDPRLDEGAYCCLEVRDNGVGMDPTVRERIFEPFFTTRPPGVGTGLGLSVVHGIVRALHGAITVDSVRGAGTCFTLYLPPAPAMDTRIPAASPVHVPQAQTGQVYHALYVDDEPALTSLIRELLEAQGVQVSTCADPRDALRRVCEGTTAFDIVVTDYNMPGMSGIDLAAGIAQRAPRLPVVISSGYVTPELQQQAAALGVRALINKVDLVHQLPDLLHELLLSRSATESRGPA